MVVAVTVQLLLGAGLLALGRWGINSSADLAPVGLPAAERRRRARSYVIGGRTCVVVGWVMIVFAILMAFAYAMGWVRP